MSFYIHTDTQTLGCWWFVVKTSVLLLRKAIECERRATRRDRQGGGGQVTKGGGVDYISNWCHKDRHIGLYGAGCCVVKTGPFPSRVFFLFLFSQCRLTFQRNIISLWSSHERIWWWWFFPRKRVLMMLHRHHRCGIFFHQRNSPVVSVNSRAPFVYAACIPSEIFSVMGDRLNWCDSL